MDDYGYLREDNGNATLDSYLIDPVIDQFYDEGENKTRIRRYVSTDAEVFTPLFYARQSDELQRWNRRG